MRRVKSAENAVPVRVIALRAEQMRLCFGPGLGSFRAFSADGLQLRGNSQHFFMQQIRFRILAEESAPETAAQKPLHVRTVCKLLLQGMKLLPHWCRQN